MAATIAATDENRARMQRVELDVTGMSCAACANRVESALNTLPGVRASVNFATRVATIDADEGIKTAELCDAVHRAGYEAELRETGVRVITTPTLSTRGIYWSASRSPRCSSCPWPTCR
jgi:copper chaperone CopZ